MTLTTPVKDTMDNIALDIMCFFLLPGKRFGEQPHWRKPNFSIRSASCRRGN